MDTLKFMLAPVCECLVLVGIHSYLGIHVLRRGVIFIDLALAQIAALGTAVGLLFGLMPDSLGAFIYSIIFTFAGAAIFAFTRFKKSPIPHEAIIGLVYATSAAMGILVMDRAATGAEHLKEILVGRIVWVRWSEVVAAAIAYSVVGIIHALFGKFFIMITNNPDEAYRMKMKVRLWDFLFYMTFGFVISFSVSVAGVLLVFVFLVAPAIASAIVTNRFSMQLLLGWCMGTFVTISGMVISYFMNFPSGPAIVVEYTLVLILIAMITFVAKSKDRKFAFLKAGVGTSAFISIFFILIITGIFLSRISFLNLSHEKKSQTSVKNIENGNSISSPGEIDLDEKIELAEKLINEKKNDEAYKLLNEIISSPETPEFFRYKATELIKRHLMEKSEHTQ